MSHAIALAHAPPKPRLVVVDDEPQVLDALTDQLEDDFTVHATGSATTALDWLAQLDDVAVLLSDQRMPGMTGDEIFARANAISDASRVMITGFADIDAVMLAVNRGRIFGYVTKPWEHRKLQAVLIKAHEHYRLVRELKHERALLHNLMQSVPDEIYFKGLDHRYIRVNHAAALGQGIASPERAQGRLDSDFMSDTQRIEQLHREDRQVAETGRPLMVDELRRMADGSEVWVSKLKAPVRDENGKVTSIVAVARDITERKRAEQALRASESVKHAILASSLDCFILMDHAGVVREFNPAAEATFGYTRAQAVGCTLAQLLVPPGDRAAHEAGLARYLATGSGTLVGSRRRLQARHADGHAIPLELSIVVIGAQSQPMFAGFARDITPELTQEQRIARLTRMHATLSGISSAIVRVRSRDELLREARRVVVETGRFLFLHVWLLDPDRRVLVLEGGAGDQDAAPREEALDVADPARMPSCVSCFLSGEMFVANDLAAQHSPTPLRRLAVELGCRSVVSVPLRANKECAGVLSFGSGDSDFFDAEELELLREIAGNLAYAFEALQQRDRLYYLASHDPLTGLANRTRFLENVSSLVAPTGSSGVPFAVLAVNLRRFRHVNESFGRATGDELLRQVGVSLREHAGANRVAHFGAGLFGVVLVDPQATRDVVRTAARLREGLGRAYTLQQRQVHVDTRIGVARYPLDGQTAEELCAHAEAALQEARSAGDPVVFYQSALNAGVAEQLELEHRMRVATRERQFVLHYQPKVDTSSGRVVSAEALIRWQDPQRGLVPPGQFVPMLEDSGLIVEVGAWALEDAARMGRQLQAAGLPWLRIAVNISQVQMRRPDFPREAVEAVLRGGGDPARMDLEITESLFADDIDDAVSKLEALRQAGFRIAVDDFGTGYSSLSYLARLPIDALKIDRSFVVNMTEDANAMALVSTIVNLAHSFELEVIAEGVDSPEQLRVLRLLRCEQVQGFLFHKPMPEAAFAELLRNERCRDD